jgi:hypothetical protein
MSFRIAETRLGSNSFWAWRIWLARTAWQQLLSNLKSLGIAEARLASNSFWARRISMAQTAWQKLLLPEELKDGGDQASEPKGSG